MVAVGKDLVLIGQVRAPAVHEVKAGQMALLRDLLCAEVLLDGRGIVGPALHGGVVADDHDIAPMNPPDPGNQPRPGSRTIIHAMRRRGPDLQERAPGIEQVRDPLAREELAARRMALPRDLAPALGGGFGGVTNLLQ
jgi:hypothetical protein